MLLSGDRAAAGSHWHVKVAKSRTSMRHNDVVTKPCLRTTWGCCTALFSVFVQLKAVQAQASTSTAEAWLDRRF
jgi:hypothetical protein